MARALALWQSLLGLTSVRLAAIATSVQVETAYRCACILRDQIKPYLLRRLKADVAVQLPKKSEQVVFCRLTPYQRRVYEQFLDSKETRQILEGRRHVLYGIDILRKICNHPDLLEGSELNKGQPGYGAIERSGKLRVVIALLDMWHRHNHRVLLFCQTRQMLDILELAVQQQGSPYCALPSMLALTRGRALV